MPSAIYPYVPASSVLLDKSSLKNLAIQKSEARASYSKSNSPFLLDISRRTIGGKQSLCKYDNASATPLSHSFSLSSPISLLLHHCSGSWPNYPFQEIHRPKTSVGHVNKIHIISKCYDVISLSRPNFIQEILLTCHLTWEW